MTGSNEVLDTLFEVLPDDIPFSASLYPPRADREDVEFYVEIAGTCWRVWATPHPHDA